MDSPDFMDSPSHDRNPSPPPELVEHEDLISAERIGNTAFSKHWLFSTLMKLIEEVDRENAVRVEGSGDGEENNEVTERSDLVVDIDEELQNELCKLWDMSMNSEVAQFLQEFKAVDILTGIVQKSKAPRVTEICVGILGNMACEPNVCNNMADNLSFIELMLLLLETRDAPTLVENTRLIYTSLSNTRTRGPWIRAIQRSEEVLDHLQFIFASSTNNDLLKNTAELVDTLLDLEADLCVSWATIDFIHSLLEATEQIGSNHSEAMEVYLHIFQSFSTSESGVEALVSHRERLEPKVLKYLNIMCEYEIVRVDAKEGPLVSAFNVLNILLSTQSQGHLSYMCKDEKLIRILLKILEPLYPMLQKYRNDSNRPISDRDNNHVTSSDQSDETEPCDQTEANDLDKSVVKNGDDTATENINSEAEKTVVSDNNDDVENLQQLEILYEILAGFILDYCGVMFKNSTKCVVSQDNNLENNSQNAADNMASAKGDNELNTLEEVNSSTKGDHSEVEEAADSCSENENDSKGDNNEGINISLPILTYLDEACSRCRINYLALCLKETPTGSELFDQLCELAYKYDKERLSRILNDVSAGRIVSLAESCKTKEDSVS